jgi:lysophospholipase L1-like esterase
MRDKEYALHKPQGTYRILVLGDSITQGGKWSEYVEDKLNGDGSGKYELLNAAVNGWGLVNYEAYLQHKGLTFEPDLVLVGFCLNDVDDREVRTILVDKRTDTVRLFSVKAPDDEESAAATLRIIAPLFSSSYLYRYLVLRAGTGRENPAAQPMQRQVARLVHMKTLARGHILGVVFPYLKPLRSYDSREAIEYRETVQALRAAKIDYLDLTPFFNTFGEKELTGFRLNPPDKIHFNDQANVLKAGLIYDWVRNRADR